MAILAVYQPDARAAARMNAALGGAHHLELRGTWPELHQILAEEGVEGCIVDADHPTRERARAEIAHLRRRHGSLAIVAYADLSGEMEYFDLGELGVDGVVRADMADGSLVRSTVDTAMVAARAARVGHALEGRYGRLGGRAVRWAMEHARSKVEVDEFALALGHAPRALATALAEAGLPTPNRLLVWGRLLVAASLLGRDGRKIEDTAFAVGYSSANAFSRAMKKHTGFTPRQVTERGGMAAVHGALFARSGRPARTLRALRALTILVGVAASSACAGIFGGSGGFDREAVDQVLDAPPMDQIHFGVLAVEARSGEILYSRNAHRKFIPASNQKVLVTSTALSLLGPDHRYRTDVRTEGVLRDGTLDGDLRVVASGDPSWSDRYWDSGESVMQGFADSAAAKGIERITGSLVIDVSAWDSATVGPTWEVEDLRYRYGSTGGAFAIDEGEITAVVTAGPDEGIPATASWWPLGTPDFLRADLITAPPDSSTRVAPHYLPQSRRLHLRGRVPLGTVDTVSFALRDPVRQAVAALSRAFAGAGIHLDSGTRIQWDRPAGATDGCGAASNQCRAGRVLYSMESPPLEQLIAGILEPSQNWMTEQLIRTLGAELGERGSWSEGVDVIEGFLVDEVGVDSLDVAARDGSGLSAYNLVTPRAMVRILQYMRRGPYEAAYRTALASPGEEDSTLERRLSGLEERVFAKTGTISNVNSLSGYLVGEEGDDIVFSILSNGSGLPASRVRAVIDDVVRVLAR